MSRLCLVCFIGFALLFAMVDSSSAMAQNSRTEDMPDLCYTMDENKDWVSGYEAFSQYYTEEDYFHALEVAHKLEGICNRSPMLNYSIGATYRKLGDYENAAEYFRRATFNAHEFEISPEVLKRIWFDYYEVDNDNRLVSRDELNDVLDELDVTRARVTTLLVAQKENLADEIRRDKILMWSGVGVAGSGVVLMIVGGALLGVTREKEDPISDIACSDSHHCAFKLNQIENAPIVLGVGIGATILGAAFAGFELWNYRHKLSSSVAVDIAPNSITLDMTF